MKSIHLEEINSTNDYVKKHMSELENLTFVYADRQTSGRGRLDRKWVDSGEENLFLTIVIKPSSPNFLSNFTQYLSVILAMVLEEEYHLPPQIKWPNDVLVNGKKIAGILAEGTTHGGVFSGLALGIGVNLNTSQKELKKIDKPATSILLYNKFCLLYDGFVCKGFVCIKEYYETKSIFLGNEISINVLGEIHRGIAEKITDEGALVLKENDKENIYYIGDIL